MRRTVHAIAVAALAVALVAPAAHAADLTNDEAAAVWRAASCPSNLAEAAFMEAVDAAGIEPGAPLTDDLRELAGAWVPRLRHVVARLGYPPAPWPVEIRWDVTGGVAAIAMEADRVERLAQAGSTWEAPMSDEETAALKEIVDRVRTAIGLPLDSDCTAADDAPAELSVDEARALWLDAQCPRTAALVNEHTPTTKAAGEAYAFGEPLPASVAASFLKLVVLQTRTKELLSHPVAPWPAVVANEIPVLVRFITQMDLFYSQAALGPLSEWNIREGLTVANEAAARVRTALGIDDPVKACGLEG
jgi:hypothetical protein